MKRRPEILHEVMFYTIERAKCEEDTDKYLDHVLDSFNKDYKKQNGLKLTMDEINHKYENERMNN